MKHQSKFKTNQEQEQTAGLQSDKKAGLEFDSIEQLLRHDAAQTAPPPAIAQRLHESIGAPETPRRPWWRRLLD